MRSRPRLTYISFDTFFADIQKFARTLPAYDAVVGVPRSGLFPASYIAMTQNIRLVELGEFLVNPREAIANAYLRTNNPKHQQKLLGRALVIDDCCSSMRRTLGNIAWIMAPHADDIEIDYAVLYREPAHDDAYPVPRLLSYKPVLRPRLFEWNWFRHSDMKAAMLDMDGVICEDWTGCEETDEEGYRQHLESARPLCLPERKVRAIVTNRLEKYRPVTEDWLARHNVAYERLVMCHAPDPAARRDGPARWELKATAIQQDPDTQFFVESEEKTAKNLAGLVPYCWVICLETGECFNA